MRMPFGKYKGTNVAELPDDYLEWLHGLDDLRGRLRRAVDAEWNYRCATEPCATAPDLDTEDRALLAELIRAGYRNLAQKYHPDHHGGDADTMRRLNALMARLRQGVLAA
jgi:hypothetical protein